MPMDPFAYARAPQSFPHLPQPTLDEQRYALEMVRVPVQPRSKLNIAQIRAAGGYSVIYSDCPWSYDDANCIGGVDRHYSTLNVDQLCSMPVQYIAAENCALFAWATFPKIEDALTVMRHWGFAFRSVAFHWVKLRGGRPQMGLGRWTRGSSEVCLLGVRGKPQRQDKGVRQLVETLAADGEILYADATRHSAKPPEVRERIVQLMGDVPRLEMFSRERVPGWDAYGFEVPGGSDVVLT